MSEDLVPLLARQPILNRQLKVVGYELLCRPTPNATAEWQEEFGDRATSDVLLAAFNELGIKEVTGGLPAFVNFTRYWLETPPVLGRNLIVAEVLEHLDHDDSLIAALARLKSLKFRIALDDYEGSPLSDEVLELVDIIKVDLPLIGSQEKLKSCIEKYQRPHIKWLAEKVETQEEFEQCLEAGCQLFQGYFYARPNELYGKRQSDNQITVMKLITVLSDKDVKVEDISQVLQSDPELSFKLLKFVNSAYPAGYGEITSVHRAIVSIGLEKIRAWSNVLALGQLDTKPLVLRQQALVRAEFCRSIACHWPEIDPEQAFTVGLFSMLDAFFDTPIETLCQQMKLAPEIEQALKNKEGPLGEILDTSIQLEQANWKSIPWQSLISHQLQADELNQRYQDAVKTAEDMLNQVN